MLKDSGSCNFVLLFSKMSSELAVFRRRLPIRNLLVSLADVFPELGDANIDLSMSSETFVSSDTDDKPNSSTLVIELESWV